MKAKIKNVIIFLYNKRLNGQITIYGAISFMFIISVVCTCIYSAQLAVVKADIDGVSTLSLESVFAGYSNKALDEFDILLLKKSDILNEQLNNAVKKNLSSINPHSKFISGGFNNFSLMTDNDGKNLFKEVIDYMDYAIYSELFDNINSSKENFTKANAVNEVTDKIVKCQENVFENDKYILELLSLTEGIKTNETGFVVRASKPVVTGKSFVKQMVNGNISADNTAVSDTRVYNILYENDGYIDISELLKNIVECIDEFEDIVDSEGEDEAIHICQLEYIRRYNILYKNTNDTIQVCKEALNVIDNYNNHSDNSINDMQAFEDLLNNKRQELGEEVYQNFLSDINDMKLSNNKNTSKLCDVDIIKKGIEQNLDILENVKDILDNTEHFLYVDTFGDIKDNINECINVFANYSLSLLEFNYTDVSFESNSDGISEFTKLYNALTNGIGSIVLNGMNVSDKDITYISQQRQLADIYISKSGINNTNNNSLSQSFYEEVKNNALYNEYLFKKFNSFTDYVDSQSNINTDTGKKLDYMLEYIIEGSMSDLSNLNGVITKLSLIRQGANMTHLITNHKKKNEAFAMAMSLVGFSGNMAIVKSAQYTIMAAWAYAESLVDVRKLCLGQKIELIKNDSAWEISLDKLLKMDWLNNTYIKDSNIQSGLDYNEYLRLLLMARQQKEKLYRTMVAMEIRMEELGVASFRMEDYICSAECEIEFYLNKVNKVYKKQLYYGYS